VIYNIIIFIILGKAKCD